MRAVAESGEIQHLVAASHLTDGKHDVLPFVIAQAANVYSHIQISALV